MVRRAAALLVGVLGCAEIAGLDSQWEPASELDASAGDGNTPADAPFDHDALGRVEAGGDAADSSVAPYDASDADGAQDAFVEGAVTDARNERR